MFERIPVYPDRYRPGQLDIDATVTFETRAGEIIDLAAAPLIAGTCGTWVLHLTNRGAALTAGAAIALIRNTIEGFTGAATFDLPAEIEGLPPTCTFTRADRGLKIFAQVRLTTPGVYRIPVRGSAGVFTSNPIVVRQQPTTRVYWGDVHAHGWGDSTMYLMHLRSEKLDPAARHLQARDTGRLDFSCPGAMSMDPEQREPTWEPYRQAWRQFDQPGQYVPFLSYEAHPPEGDRQVIFKGDEPAPPSMRAPMSAVEAQYGTRDDVLLEVHIGGAHQRDSAYGTGPLTAVCALELTRDALWEGIESRRTYATSGARIFLEVIGDGQPAGARIELRDPFELSLACHACAPIARLCLICDELNRIDIVYTFSYLPCHGHSPFSPRHPFRVGCYQSRGKSQKTPGLF